MKHKYLIALASFFITIISSNAEEPAAKTQPDLVITGLIQDESDNVLPRVQVRVSGTQDITQTNGNGEFTLNVS